ncbi:MAG TPA: PilZ domain-containing protein [Proteobacteria bacterium]|nr:PilZ domain-containing protein [Pseudomonadota bacterium]
MDEQHKIRRRHPRTPLSAKVEFFVDADIVTAKTVDISDGGLQITTFAPVRALLRVTEESGMITEYETEMIWARKGSDQQMIFGLKIIDSDYRVLEIASF